jgi:putative transferase (TIGR04331 family)
MTNNGRKSGVNIRASADEDFWGTAFDNSIHLWAGSKSRLTLSEIEKNVIPTNRDLFSTKEEITRAHDHCKAVYLELLPKLTEILNKIHGTNLSENFWKTVFGYWLFRHICIVFEKYSYLSTFDLDRTSIILLARKSFYIPNDHYDYVRCFCNDFGVQQIVSHYYYHFSNKEFPIVSKACNLTQEKQDLDYQRNLIVREPDILPKNILKRLLLHIRNRRARNRNNPRVAICGAYFPDAIKQSLMKESGDQIDLLFLPMVITYETSIDEAGRNELLKIESNDEFINFLVQTLHYSFPKILIEYFRSYYNTFLDDIKKSRFTHIVTECWRSFLPISIYIAIAKNLNRKIIFQQHGASIQWLNCCLSWMEYENADFFLTTGWKSNNSKIIQGGFTCSDISPYRFSPRKKNILYIGTTRFKYLMQFGEFEFNNNFLKQLRMAVEFFDLLPPNLRENFYLRTRKVRYFWDTGHTWEVDRRNLQIDTEDFSKSLSKARIVVIDHISTGVGEILANGTPCLIIHHDQIAPLSVDFKNIFNDLRDCGVVHNSPHSAMRHLIEIYDNVEQWWTSIPVQKAINDLVGNNISPPSRTIDFLLSRLNMVDAP